MLRLFTKLLAVKRVLNKLHYSKLLILIMLIVENPDLIEDLLSFIYTRPRYVPTKPE